MTYIPKKDLEALEALEEKVSGMTVQEAIKYISEEMELEVEQEIVMSQKKNYARAGNPMVVPYKSLRGQRILSDDAIWFT